MPQLLQAPRCEWVVFVDTRGRGDEDFFVERERNRADARATARGWRRQGCRVRISGGHGGMAVVPDWYTPNARDLLVDSDYLNP